jgi:hypothetical protein
MGNLIEPYKYCADVLKYSGFAFLTPVASLVLSLTTDFSFTFDPNQLERYVVAGLFFILGLKFILQGLSILQKGVIDESAKS